MVKAVPNIGVIEERNWNAFLERWDLLGFKKKLYLAFYFRGILGTNEIIQVVCFQFQ